jgi:polyhydroxybutyrate depolymerase
MFGQPVSIMKTLLKALAGLLLVAFVVGGLLTAWYLRWDEIEPPDLPGKLVAGTLEHEGRQRSWQVYVPASLGDSPPVLLLLHPSTGDGSYMRASTFYEFDILAERAGFLAVYPDGFEQHWNDCRAGASYSANTLNVDDVGFLLALVETLARDYGADLTRVFVAGNSNGGQMAYRMAMEAPGSVAGIASIAASLPVQDNLDCQPQGRAVATLVINGTDDPVNPHQGGRVEFLGSSRGEVLSSLDTALYWARLAGHAGEGAREVWPGREPNDGTSVESTSWSGSAGPPVQLLTVVGGGHTLPHPVYKLPRLIGPTSNQLDGAGVIWSFFSRGLPVAP